MRWLGVVAFASIGCAAPSDGTWDDGWGDAFTGVDEEPGCRDRDGDGVCNAADNCPDTPNRPQRDADGNGIGDACDVDPPPADTGEPPVVEDYGDFFVEYEPPVDPYHQDWEGYLLALGLLDDAAWGVNARFALPRDAWIVAAECGMANAFWVPSEHVVVMCYELLVDVADAFYYSGGDLTDDQIIGATVNTYTWVLYHEIGHGLVDLLDVPITGREEDAVDEFSTLLFIEEGAGGAALDAAIYFYLMDKGTHAPSQLADEHSLGLQRFYNVLCLVYGSDPAGYQDIVDGFPEMERRAPRCPGEYQQKQAAWERLLAPYEL